MFKLLTISLLLLSSSLTSTLAHSSHSHRHRSTVRRLRRQQDNEEVVAGSGQDCQVQLPQREIDEWSTWMQEGFSACTQSAAASLKPEDPTTQVVMCYRIGFVDAGKQRFGGELLVMQVGNSDQAPPSLSSSESSTESAIEASTEPATDSSSSATSSDSSSTRSGSAEASPSSAAPASSSGIVDLTAVSSSEPANLGVVESASSSSSAGIGAAVVGFNTVDVSSSATASVSSSAVGIGAAIVSSSAVPFPTARARMIRRQKDATKLPRGQFKVQVSWGAGSQATTSSMVLVDDLGDDLISSTTIDAPSFKGLIGDEQAQLIGSTHFTRAFPSGVDFDGKDLTVLSPSSIDLIGQAGTMASVNTVLVDLASVSAGMTGFSDEPRGLFTASSARSNKLTFDDRCIVTPDEGKVDAGASSSESVSETSSVVETSTSVESSSSATVDAAAAAVETASSSTIAGEAGIGAQFLSSSAVPFTPAAAAAAAASSSTSAASVPTSTISLAGANVVSASSSAAASSSSLAEASAAAANEQAFQLPGREIQVLPIGMGVFAGVSVLALAIVGIVTYERRKYRAQFRARKMAEQVAHASYGGTGIGMREGRV